MPRKKRQSGYASHLPRSLRALYERARNDPDLLAATEEVALLRVRIGELLEQLRHGGQFDAEEALDRYGECMANLPAEPSDTFMDAFASLGEVLRQNVTVKETWQELYEAIDKKTWVASREWKRRVDLRQVITAERAMALITAVMAAVIRHVPDVTTRAQIRDEIAGLTNADLIPYTPQLPAAPMTLDIRGEPEAAGPGDMEGKASPNKACFFGNGPDVFGGDGEGI